MRILLTTVVKYRDGGTVLGRPDRDPPWARTGAPNIAGPIRGGHFHDDRATGGEGAPPPRGTVEARLEATDSVRLLAGPSRPLERNAAGSFRGRPSVTSGNERGRPVSGPALRALK